MKYVYEFLFQIMYRHQFRQFVVFTEPLLYKRVSYAWFPSACDHIRNSLWWHIILPTQYLSAFVTSVPAFSSDSRSFMGTPDAVTSQCLGVSGCVILFINGFYLTVTSPDGNRLGRFNICNLRRYGFTAKTFHVETGRKSMFGEGTFTFFTTQVSPVFQS